MEFLYRNSEGDLKPLLPVLVMLFFTVAAFFFVMLNEATYHWVVMNTQLHTGLVFFLPYFLLMAFGFLWISIINNINNRNDFNTKQYVPVVRFSDIVFALFFSLGLSFLVFMAVTRLTPIDEVSRIKVVYENIMEIDNDHYALPLIDNAINSQNWEEVVSLVRRFGSEAKPEDAIALRVIAASVKKEYKGFAELQNISSSRYISSQDFEDQIMKISRAPEAIKNDNANVAMAISKIIGINGRG